MSVSCPSNSIVVARKKSSKAGSDRIKSMIDSSKVYDGKHVELQQILNTSQNPTVWVHRNCVNILFKKVFSKELTTGNSSPEVLRF